MKEAVTKVIDTLTQEDFHGVFQKLLERYKTVPQPPCSRDLAPCDFWLFPKLRGCRYETIEEMKEAVTKVIDMLTQGDFHG